MPKILDRLVRQLRAKGIKNPYPIAISALQRSGNLKKWTKSATKKWIKRGKMTPWQRAIDRAVKKRWWTKSSYKYKRSNNTAVKRKSHKFKKKG